MKKGNVYMGSKWPTAQYRAGLGPASWFGHLGLWQPTDTGARASTCAWHSQSVRHGELAGDSTAAETRSQSA
jgi:hypothetical protein